MTLVDGPTEESDNVICVAYRHQFDVVNESTGEAFRLHHVEAGRVSWQLRAGGTEDAPGLGLPLCDARLAGRVVDITCCARQAVPRGVAVFVAERGSA